MTELLKKNWRLIASLAVAVFLLALAWAWRGALLPFLIGAVLAYLMLPGIKWLEAKLPPKGKWRKGKRVASMLIVLLSGILALLLFISFIVITVIETFSELFSRTPEYIANIINWLQGWAEGFQQQLPPGLQIQVEQFIANLGLQLENILQNVAQQGFSIITGSFDTLLGFVALPLFLFYIIKDYEKLRRTTRSLFPGWAIEHARNIAFIIERVLGRYLRARLILGASVAVMAFIGLTLMGLPYATALAFFAGMTELVPVIGPWLGAILAILVALGIAPGHIILVALLFLGIQLIKTKLLVPNIQGSQLGIHPVLIVLILVLGLYTAGIWGILFAVPVAATFARIFEYIGEQRMAGKEEGGQNQPPCPNGQEKTV